MQHDHSDERMADPLAGVGEAAPDDPRPLADPSPAPPARVEPVVVPRWVQLVLLPLILLGAWALLRAAGPVVLLFVVAGLIALLLNPFVTLLRRRRVPRGVAVAIVFLCVGLVLTGVGVLAANPVSSQVSSFANSVPGLVRDANRSLDDLQTWLDDNGVNVEVKEPGRTALSSLGGRVARGSGEIAAFTRDALLRLVEASLALILIVVLSVYMLLYGERIGALVRSIVPRGDGTPEDDFPNRIQSAVFNYVRGQLLFSAIMGASAGMMLFALGTLGIFPQGREYALFFGAFYGFAELIPYVGPAIGAFPPVAVAALSDQPLDALWLIVAFTLLQQIEGHVVAPNVFSHALRINPLLVIFALLMGGQLYGLPGAFIALPVAAVIRETAVYMRRHLVLEPWPSTAAPALVGAGTGIAACPECGAPRPPGAETCPRCGTELGPPDAYATSAAAGPG
jgi:putative heme transporter